MRPHVCGRGAETGGAAAEGGGVGWGARTNGSGIGVIINLKTLLAVVAGMPLVFRVRVVIIILLLRLCPLLCAAQHSHSQLL